MYCLDIGYSNRAATLVAASRERSLRAGAVENGIAPVEVMTIGVVLFEVSKVKRGPKAKGSKHV